MAEKTVSLLSSNASYKQIQLTNQVASVFAYVDENMLDLIIRNLVSNAIKFCSAGDKIVLSSNQSNGMIKLSVSDTGIGMSEAELQKIFGNQMISVQGSNEEVGVGLGLMLCKEFVEMNGGEIGVQSEQGKGSTFWFTLKKSQMIS
jgi:signal transduction histidine kinase